MGDTVVADDEKLASAGFNEGFTQDTPPEPVAAVVQPEAKVEPKPEVKPKTEAKAPPTPDPVVAQPKYRQITEDEYTLLHSAAAKTAEIEKQVSKVFGTVGNMQQIVNKLQSATPAGTAIELPPDVVSEMEKDFPELAGHFKSALEKALKGVRGTGPATGATVDPEAVSKLVNTAMEAATVKREIEALEDDHPTWKEIVGAIGPGETPNPNNPFRVWLGKQSAEYQAKINSTNSSTVISKAIDKFLDSQKAPAKVPQPTPKVVAQQSRIKDAIQPRGDGGQPTPRNTEEDAFSEGFRTG